MFRSFLFLLISTGLFAKFEPAVLEHQIQEALKEYQIPGIAIGIVADGNIIYAKGFGERNREQNLPVSIDTIFPIGSCTKAFTTFSFGALAEERLISWDQLVTGLIPKFQLSSQDTTERASFRDLCSNQVGMPRHDYIWYNTTLTQEELLQRLPHLELSSGLRKRFEYNNLMFLITGMAMEQARGQKWEEILSEKILSPLGMNRTSWSIDLLQKSHDFALPYLEKGGVLKRMPFRDVSFVKPAGGLNSSVREMSQWVKMLLDQGRWEGKPLVQPQTVAELFKPQIQFTVSANSVSGYGLGWYVNKHSGHEQVTHDGGVDGFTALVALLPKDKIGVVILCNKNLCPFPRLLAMHVFDLLLDLPSTNQIKGGLEGIQKYQESAPELQEKEEANRKIAAPSHPLQDYVGTYSHPGYGTIEVGMSNGALILNYHQIGFLLEPWHFDVFRICEESQDLQLSLIGKKVAFRGNFDGNIDEIQIPMDLRITPILFKRVQEKNPPFQKSSYLNRFVGVYEIYNYLIEITVQDDVLIAHVPGQPPYELISKDENEFLIKSHEGHIVRFVMNVDETVKEVHLRQPYGIVFTARPSKVGF